MAFLNRDHVYPSKHTHEELANRFTHHPPHGDQLGRYAMVRDICLDAAKKIVELTPACDEQSQAVGCLDMAMMMANAAISRHTPTGTRPPSREERTEAALRGLMDPNVWAADTAAVTDINGGAGTWAAASGLLSSPNYHAIRRTLIAVTERVGRFCVLHESQSQLVVHSDLARAVLRSDEVREQFGGLDTLGAAARIAPGQTFVVYGVAVRVHDAVDRDKAVFFACDFDELLSTPRAWGVRNAFLLTGCV